MLRRFLALAFAGVLLANAGAVEAKSNVKTLTQRLSKGNNAKVRMSAALSLAKSSDHRAVVALSESVVKDASPDVRRVAVATLGAKLHQGLEGKQRETAIEALKSARKKDRDPKVRSSAEVALQKAEKPRTERKQSQGVLVHIRLPEVSPKLPKSTANLVHQTIKHTIESAAPKFVHTAPSTGTPSSRASQLDGLFIVPSIEQLSLQKRGSSAKVSCKMKLTLQAVGQEGDHLDVGGGMIVTGAGEVHTRSSKKAATEAAQDCLQAVTEQVTRNQVVPFLAKRGR